MLNLRFSLLAASVAVLLSGCTRTLSDLEKKRDKALSDLIATTSGSAVQDSTSQRAGLELRLLDSLQHKYPGRTRTTVITKTEKVVVPGQVVYVEVPAKTTPAEAARNQSLVDSLTRKLAAQAAQYREDLALNGQVAEVKKNLLQELNKRGALPDTTVLFPNAPGYWLRVFRLANGRYSFTLNTPERTAEVPTRIETTNHQPVVYIRKEFWQYAQFWVVAGLAFVGWLLLGYFVYLYAFKRYPVQ